MEKISLADAHDTRRDVPVSALIYGGGGVGKSTLCASAPDCLILKAEDGLAQIKAKGLTMRTWQDTLDAIDLLTNEKHDYKSVGFDSLDKIEAQTWDHVCGLHKKKSIEAFDYGKGYVYSLEQWRLLLKKLELLRAARGMNIVFIAHALMTTVKNPEGEDYDRWNIKLQDSKKVSLSGAIVEWADNVGFMSHEVLTEETSGRAKGIATGKVILRFQPAAGFVAKTRYKLPAKLIVPETRGWEVLAEAIRAGDPAKISSMKETLEERIRLLADPEVESKVRAFVKDRGETVPVLADALERLDITIAERRKAS